MGKVERSVGWAEGEWVEIRVDSIAGSILRRPMVGV